MDETGCPPQDLAKEKVVGARGTKTQHRQGSADRENVTAIVTICADGTVLSPTIILEPNDLSLTLNEGSATLRMDGPMVSSAWHG